MKIQLIKFGLIAVLFLSGISELFAKTECTEGKIKFTYRKKEIIQVEKYCYDTELKILLSDKICPKNLPCQTNLKTLEVKMSEIANESGSLGFKICEKYKGIPQIIEYWGDNKWNSNSRCVFGDGSFMDISSVTQKVKYVD